MGDAPKGIKSFKKDTARSDEPEKPGAAYDRQRGVKSRSHEGRLSGFISRRRLAADLDKVTLCLKSAGVLILGIVTLVFVGPKRAAGFYAHAGTLRVGRAPPCQRVQGGAVRRRDARSRARNRRREEVEHMQTSIIEGTSAKTSFEEAATPTKIEKASTTKPSETPYRLRCAADAARAWSPESMQERLPPSKPAGDEPSCEGQE